MRAPTFVPTRILVMIAALGLAAACSEGNGGTAQDTIDEGTADATDPGTPDTTTPDTADTPPIPVDWDAFFAPTAWVDDGKTRVVILHTNDLHSHLGGLGPQADFTPGSIGDDATIGGFARIAAMIERVRRDVRPGADMLALDAGDFTFGSAFSYLSRTEGIELKILAAMGYAGATLGNHEIDWTPNGAAAVVSAGLPQDASMKVLASNLVFPDGDAEAADLAALMGKQVQPYRVVTLTNGVKVGLFGLLGTGAIKLSPHAAPVTVRDPNEAAAEVVNVLRTTEMVDLVVCLSHMGVAENDVTGEDEKLAAAVTGIDVIVSGHTHTLMTEPLKVGNTLIVQAGQYGEHLGKLVLVRDGTTFGLESWAAQTVDDTTPGLPEITALVTDAAGRMGDTMLKGTGRGYDTAVATTGFDLLPAEFAETNLGDFVADAVRWTTTQYSAADPIEVVFEANGVIRDGLRKGRTGELRVGDLVQVLPLGIGPDGEMGYPMLAFYLTAAEVRTALEVIAGLAPIVADSFYLQVSGLRFEFDPNADLLYMVDNVWLGDEVNGFDTTPLDTSETNPRLIRVATNMYIAQMLGVLQDYTGGLVVIQMKDKDGNAITDLEQAILDIDPAKAGVQELKLWRTLIEYAASFPKDAGTGLPAIPARYAASQDRAHRK